MYSHEVDTEAKNPLLISLFAQATLGLIQDMARCVCWMPSTGSGRCLEPIPLYRCSETGLLLICLSKFDTNSLPKCIRSHRIRQPLPAEPYACSKGLAAMALDTPAPCVVNGIYWDPQGANAEQLKNHKWKSCDCNCRCPLQF